MPLIWFGSSVSTRTGRRPNGWSTVDALSGRVLAAADDLRTGYYGAKPSRGRDLFNKDVALGAYRDPAGGRFKLIDTSKFMHRRYTTSHPYSKWNGAIEVRSGGNRVDSNGDPVESARFPTVVRPARGNLFTDRAAVSLARDFSLTYDTYLAVFGRNSLNGKGISVVGNVHFGKAYDNAYWSPEKKMMFFGDNIPSEGKPFPRALDVVAHEYTHGVTYYSVRENGTPNSFTYSGQSGAIDEGFSDVFACVVDWGDWTMGEDLGGSAMRSLQNPGVYDQPNSMFDYYSMPTELDNGGVHYNDSLIGYADYLIATQLNAGGMTARDARNAAAQVFYQAYRYLDGFPDASLQTAALALVRAAGDIDAARGDGLTTMQQLVTSKLTEVGILQSTVLQYDDGSIVSSDGTINDWQFNNTTYGASDSVAVQFDRPSAVGDPMTVQVGTYTEDDKLVFNGQYSVTLMTADTNGYPDAVIAQIAPSAGAILPVTPRYDGVFTNFRLTTAIHVPDKFCVVVSYSNPAGGSTPWLVADSGTTYTGRSYVHVGGRWARLSDLSSRLGHDFMIRVIWDPTAP